MQRRRVGDGDTAIHRDVVLRDELRVRTRDGCANIRRHAAAQGDAVDARDMKARRNDISDQNIKRLARRAARCRIRNRDRILRRAACGKIGCRSGDRFIKSQHGLDDGDRSSAVIERCRAECGVRVRQRSRIDDRRSRLIAEHVRDLGGDVKDELVVRCVVVRIRRDISKREDRIPAARDQRWHGPGKRRG